MAHRFQNRIVLVTGRNSGIGGAAALAFAGEGAAVLIAARDAESGTAVVREIHSTCGEAWGPGHPSALFVPTDVTSPADCQGAVTAAMETFSRLDVLVNNAGVILREKTVVDTTPEEWDLTLGVNVKGTYLMSRAAIPAMRQSAGMGEHSGRRPSPVLEGVSPPAVSPVPGAAFGPSIVNNASYMGVVGGRGVAAYSAAKGAVVNLNRAMALDHASEGIRVNCIAPGSVETPMLHREWEEMGGEAGVSHLFEEKHPLGRISQPKEVAAAILFLASADASFTNGVCLPVDAGLTAG